MRDSLEHYLGSSIHIITYPQALTIGEGLFDAALAKTHAMAQKTLNDKRGDLLVVGYFECGGLIGRVPTAQLAVPAPKEPTTDLLIWGRVKSANALALYFTGRSTETAKTSPYPYTRVSDAERAIELPLNFDRDLGAAFAARVVAVGDALIDRQGNFLTPYAERFAKWIAPLVAHPKANWTPDARGRCTACLRCLENACRGRAGGKHIA